MQNIKQSTCQNDRATNLRLANGQMEQFKATNIRL